MVEPKPYKTKLCKIFMTRGHCPRQVCSFAHGDMELRQFMGSFNGRRDSRDLRDKLGRRQSTMQRHSPGRYTRPRHSFRGYSPSRLARSSERKNKRNSHLDGHSAFSGSLRNSDGSENRAKERNVTSSSAKGVFQEQLKQVLSDIDKLKQLKVQLEVNLEETSQEADSLTSKIQELESQLDDEKEKCKRITSKVKKFVKAHSRHSRIQNDLKRSEVRLQKLGDQLGSEVMRLCSNEEDLNINIVSEGENAALHVNLQSEPQKDAFSSKKRSRMDGNATEELKQAKGGGYQDGSKKHSRWSSHPSQSRDDKEDDAANNGSNGHTTLAYEARQKKMRTSDANKSKASELELLVPTTSMAAHAIDEVDILVEDDTEVVETATGNEKGSTYISKRFPFPLPLPPPIPRNSYAQYEGDDVEVDVDGAKEETVLVDIV